MSSSAKKIIIVASVVLFVGAIGVGVYFGLQESRQFVIPFLPNGDTPQNIPSNNAPPFTPPPTNQQDDQPSGQLQVLVESGVVDAWVYYEPTEDDQGDPTFITSLLYVTDQGEVYQLKGGQDAQKIADAPYTEPVRITTNLQGNYAVAQFAQGESSIFDVAERVWRQTRQSADSFAFAPSGNAVALSVPETTGTQVYVQDPSSSDQTLLIELAALDATVAWPQDDVVWLIPRPADRVAQNVWQIDIKQRTVQRIKNGRQLAYSFSMLGTGQGVFWEQERTGQAGLYQMNTLSDKGTKLPFITVPEKCSFIGESLVCGVPQQADARDIFEGYYMHSMAFHDDIVMMQDGTSKTLLQDTPQIHIDTNSILFDGTAYYITDRTSGTLYRMTTGT
jgi:hypothetical protein